MKSETKSHADAHDLDVPPMPGNNGAKQSDKGYEAHVPRREEDVSCVAIQWFLTLNDLAMTDAQRIAFATWLVKDPKHQIAMKEVERLWFLMGEALKVDHRPSTSSLVAPHRRES